MEQFEYRNFVISYEAGVFVARPTPDGATGRVEIHDRNLFDLTKHIDLLWDTLDRCPEEPSCWKRWVRHLLSGLNVRISPNSLFWNPVRAAKWALVGFGGVIAATSAYGNGMKAIDLDGDGTVSNMEAHAFVHRLYSDNDAMNYIVVLDGKKYESNFKVVGDNLEVTLKKITD